MTSPDQATLLAAAQRTLDIEIGALQSLRAALGDSFCRAVEAIHSAAGRVVVTGIGKSAIVAQKIAATLNSTGSPALFMHAADAVHGDMGTIQPGDVLLCLSKSGGTAEIKVLVPLVKSMGNLVVGMVANPDSWLARHADFTLLTPVSEEADPNNLAPTASTTAQMALGDALAVSLLAVRGFSPADFAQFHPGGTLGKQLYLRVRDIYTQNERPAVRPDTGIHDVIIEMTSKRLGCTAVLDHNNKVQGIITDGDLRRLLERGAPVRDLTMAEVMTRNPLTIGPRALAAEAAQLIESTRRNQLLVVDDGRVVGALHAHDLTAARVL